MAAFEVLIFTKDYADELGLNLEELAPQFVGKPVTAYFATRNRVDVGTVTSSHVTPEGIMVIVEEPEVQ